MTPVALGLCRRQSAHHPLPPPFSSSVCRHVFFFPVFLSTVIPHGGSDADSSNRRVRERHCYAACVIRLASALELVLAAAAAASFICLSLEPRVSDGDGAGAGTASNWKQRWQWARRGSCKPYGVTPPPMPPLFLDGGHYYFF